MSPLAVGRELISSWDCREFGPAEWWRSNSLTPRIESLTTLLKANVNIDSSNNLARLVITSLQIITMTRNTLIELRQIKKAAVYRQWRDEDDEQRLDLPMALHPSLSEALTLATRPDLASLRCRTTSHHSRRCSSPPRRGDSMRHGAACLVLLWRHCCKRDGKIKNKIEKELSKELKRDIFDDLEIFCGVECGWWERVGESGRENLSYRPCEKIWWIKKRLTELARSE